MNSREEEVLKGLLQAGIALSLMEECGFQPAQSSSLPSDLRSIKPDGSTALYDAMMTGVSAILKLNDVLEKLEMNEVWNFVHIVLTDGEDNSSKVKIEEAGGLMALIGLTIQKAVIKTWLIGVGIDRGSKAHQDLQNLAACGGENAEFATISDVKINEIFEKIIVDVGIQRSVRVAGIATDNVALVGVREEYNPVLLIKKQRFAVLFNLDISGSMSGARWNRVCQSVSNFVQFLGEGDLVAGIVFNNVVKIITAPKAEPSYNSRPQNSRNQQLALPGPNPSYTQRPVYNNNSYHQNYNTYNTSYQPKPNYTQSYSQRSMNNVTRSNRQGYSPDEDQNLSNKYCQSCTLI